MICRASILAAAAGALAACAALPADAPPPPLLAPAACPAFASSDWAAWVNATPGPSASPRLMVTGKLAAPTGGYRWAWGEIQRLESYPVQIVAELRVTPPAGTATQAMVTHDIRGEWPLAEPIGAVSVRCGDRVIARISPVETVH